MNRFTRTRHNIILTSILLFLLLLLLRPLLQRHLSDDAWTRILFLQHLSNGWILILLHHPTPTTLRARPTRSSSSKVAKSVSSPDTSQSTMPLCPRAPIMSECGRKIDVRWLISADGGNRGKPRVV